MLSSTPSIWPWSPNAILWRLCSHAPWLPLCYWYHDSSSDSIPPPSTATHSWSGSPLLPFLLNDNWCSKEWCPSQLLSSFLLSQQLVHHWLQTFFISVDLSLAVLTDTQTLESSGHPETHKKKQKKTNVIYLDFQPAVCTSFCSGKCQPPEQYSWIALLPNQSFKTTEPPFTRILFTLITVSAAWCLIDLFPFLQFGGLETLFCLMWPNSSLATSRGCAGDQIFRSSWVH